MLNDIDIDDLMDLICWIIPLSIFTNGLSITLIILIIKFLWSFEF